jgi:hypothetical protein
VLRLGGSPAVILVTRRGERLCNRKVAAMGRPCRAEY